jgi:hypothetical protein
MDTTKQLHSHCFAWEQEQIQSAKPVFCFQHETVAEVKEPGITMCNMPLSEPFRIDLNWQRRKNGNKNVYFNIPVPHVIKKNV